MASLWKCMQVQSQHGGLFWLFSLLGLGDVGNAIICLMQTMLNLYFLGCRTLFPVHYVYQSLLKLWNCVKFLSVVSGEENERDNVNNIIGYEQYDVRTM